MEVIGIILIIVVIVFFALYFVWTRKEERATETSSGQKATVVVKGAYSPNVIKAKVGKPLSIVFDRQEDSECSKRVIIAEFGIAEEIPSFGKKEITITPKTAGEYTFSCEMGMYQGKIVVE